MNLNLRPRLRRASAIAWSTLNDPRRKGVRLVFVRPCYWVVDRLGPQSTIIDMGLGFDADFSQAMIERFGLKSIGFDPTRKHQESLRKIADSSSGRFEVNDLAIGPQRQMTTFNESQQNVSGSMLNDHPNVLHDSISSYDVQVITVADALAKAEKIDLVKMDIEGAEYDVLEQTPDEVIRRVDQWIVEFHHDMIERFHFSRTRRNIQRFKRLGYEVFTRDNVNFLFYIK
jgi:FkbM family methyltransferase